MLLEQLKVNKGLEVYVTREEYRYHLMSLVEKTEPGKVYVSLIAFGSQPFAFKPRDYVEVVYIDQEKMWKWSEIKVSYAKVDKSKLLCFECSRPGELFNRRETFRLPVSMEIDLARFSPVSPKADMNHFNMNKLAEDLLKEGIEKSIVHVVIKDISESGAGFYSPTAMKVGDQVRFRFQTEFGIITCEGEIVRAAKNTWNKYNLFYGCNFLKADKKLSKFILVRKRQHP